MLPFIIVIVLGLVLVGIFSPWPNPIEKKRAKQRAIKNQKEQIELQKLRRLNYGHTVDPLAEVEKVLATPPDEYSYVLHVEDYSRAMKLGWKIESTNDYKTSQHKENDAIIRVALRNDGILDADASATEYIAVNLSAFATFRNRSYDDLKRFSLLTDRNEERLARQEAILIPIKNWSESAVDRASGVVPRMRVI